MTQLADVRIRVLTAKWNERGDQWRTQDLAGAKPSINVCVCVYRKRKRDIQAALRLIKD